MRKGRSSFLQKRSKKLFSFLSPTFETLSFNIVSATDKSILVLSFKKELLPLP